MRILVTGAGGYVGIPLCEFLAKEHEVTGIDRYYFGKYPQCRYFVYDLRDIYYEHLESVDCVIDLAGLSNDMTADIDPELTRDINFMGAVRLAKLAKESGVKRYLYSSSASVYGQGMNLKEADKLNPLTLYAKCKRDVEYALLALNDKNFQVVILRNATIFGLAPRMRFDLAINIMTLRAYKEKILYVMQGGEQWRCFVHVQDVVRAFQHLILNGKAGEIYNVGSNDLNYQIKDLAALVCKELPETRIYNVPDNPDKRDYNLCFDKVNSIRFFTTFTVQDGIKEIHEALKNGFTDDPTCYTLQWYKSLIEWDKRINDLKINGKLI